jgi:hypothetical protein
MNVCGTGAMFLSTKIILLTAFEIDGLTPFKEKLMKRIFSVFSFCVILSTLGCEKEPEISDVWAEKAPLLETFRNDPLGFSINGKGYVGLGQILSSERLQDWWEYDPSTDSWTKKGDFPGRWFREGISVATKTKGYVGLGVYIEELPDSSIKAEASKDIWEYDPLKDKWTLISQYPGKGSLDASTFVIGDKIYVAAGNEPGVETAEACKSKDELWEFDTSTNTWTQKKNIPFPIYDCSLNLLKGYGFSSEENGYLLYDEALVNQYQLWKYNYKEDSWLREPKNFISGWGPQFIFVFDKIAYVGEFDSWLFERYDLENRGDESVFVADFKGNNSSGTSWMINNKGYVFVNDGRLWEYIP